MVLATEVCTQLICILKEFVSNSRTRVLFGVQVAEEGA